MNPAKPLAVMRLIASVSGTLRVMALSSELRIAMLPPARIVLPAPPAPDDWLTAADDRALIRGGFWLPSGIAVPEPAVIVQAA